MLAAADLTLAGMAATLAPAPWAGGAAQAQPIHLASTGALSARVGAPAAGSPSCPR